MYKMILKIALAVLLAVSGSAYANNYSFYGITNNNAADITAGEAQLTVDVTDPSGSNNVLFTFYNVGSNASSIADIYFDDGTLLALSTLTGSTGVSFSQGASPQKLPGGNGASPGFVNTAGFSADSDSPVQHNGVNPGEWLSVLFTLQSGQEYGTVLSSLQSGALRIGIHVQGFSSGGSESFVNTISAPVPEPEIYGMMLAGLGLMGLMGRSRISARA